MKPTIIYVLVFALLLALAIYLQKKFCILCNQSTTNPKPYSFSRSQLVWWTFIIFACFISVIIASGKIPTFSDSTLILLGIGSLTTVSARLIDISDDKNAAQAGAQIGTLTNIGTVPAVVAPPVIVPPVETAATIGTDASAVTTPATTITPTVAKPSMARDINHDNFLLDILSDKNGISIHRLQAFVFNMVFGLWFIYSSFQSIKAITINSTQAATDGVIPIITNNNLILLGVSAGLYATLKTTENK